MYTNIQQDVSWPPVSDFQFSVSEMISVTVLKHCCKFSPPIKKIMCFMTLICSWWTFCFPSFNEDTLITALTCRCSGRGSTWTQTRSSESLQLSCGPLEHSLSDPWPLMCGIGLSRGHRAVRVPKSQGGATFGLWITSAQVPEASVKVPPHVQPQPLSLPRTEAPHTEEQRQAIPMSLVWIPDPQDPRAE